MRIFFDFRRSVNTHQMYIHKAFKMTACLQVKVHFSKTEDWTVGVSHLSVFGEIRDDRISLYYLYLWLIAASFALLFDKCNTQQCREDRDESEVMVVACF